jgi:hypothetical protein
MDANSGFSSNAPSIDISFRFGKFGARLHYPHQVTPFTLFTTNLTRIS